MGYPVEVKENNAASTLLWERVSKKKGKIVARKLRGMEVPKAKSFLNGLMNEDHNIDGKHHTKPAEALLRGIESAEKNAKDKGLGENLKVRTITCEVGPKRYRRKSLGKRQKGTLVRRMKICHIKTILEDPDYKPKSEEKPKAEEKKETTKTETKPVEKETKAKQEPKEEKKSTDKKPAEKKPTKDEAKPTEPVKKEEKSEEK